MKNLRRSFDKFCYTHRNVGIPNLMLFICAGNAVVYLMTTVSKNMFLYYWLYFSRPLILQGQVWRLFTYPLTLYSGMTGGAGLLLVVISLLCYYSLGMVMEKKWGTLKFNLFYLSGVVLMDIYAMCFQNCPASASYLNMSLFLGYATTFPNATFLLYMIIPIKAWFFALAYLGLVLAGMLQDPFPVNLFPLIALANYFLFFGPEVLNLFPDSFRLKVRKFFKMKGSSAPQPKVIQFHPTQQPQRPVQQNYTHRCTVCGRTDVSNPELEFRYCSRCVGYHCYCEDHISNHTHIQ